MDIAASLIKLIFGSKADKDCKQIEPYLEKIKAVYPAIEALSNDELRARSEALKKQIADFIAADEARIVELKAKLELAETSLEEKEKVSKEIDETTKRIDEKIEEKLDEILPEAFAIMKDTARRPERDGSGHGQRFRPRSGRRQGFRNHRGRQGRIRQSLDGRRQRPQVGHDPLRRTAVRRRCAPQRQDRREGDGRRKDPRGDAPRIPQRPRKKGRAPRDGQ